MRPRYAVMRLGYAVCCRLRVWIFAGLDWSLVLILGVLIFAWLGYRVSCNFLTAGLTSRLSATASKKRGHRAHASYRTMASAGWSALQTFSTGNYSKISTNSQLDWQAYGKRTAISDFALYLTTSAL